MSSARLTPGRFRMLSWLTTAAVLSYVCRNAIGVAESTIRRDLALTEVQSGFFMSAFFWTYALMQVPAGEWARRRGTRLALTCFALGWCVATAGIGLSRTLTFLIVAQLVMGIAQAGIFPASCESVRHWMPLSERTAACGIIAAGMQIGAIIAASLTGIVMQQWGWRSVFLLFALPVLYWVILFYWWFRDRPQVPVLKLVESAAENVASEKKQTRPQKSGFNLLLVLLCGQQVARAAGYMFFASWFPTFLQKTRGIEVSDSGYLQGVVMAATLIGSLLGGWLTDWLWQRTGSIRISRCLMGGASLLGCAGLTTVAYFVNDTMAAITLLAAGAFFAALAGPCAIAATIDIGGQKTAIVYGTMNMCGNLAAAACPAIVGAVFSATENWNVVLLNFAALYLAGAFCWLIAARKGSFGTRQHESETA